VSEQALFNTDCTRPGGHAVTQGNARRHSTRAQLSLVSGARLPSCESSAACSRLISSMMSSFDLPGAPRMLMRMPEPCSIRNCERRKVRSVQDAALSGMQSRSVRV